MPPAVGGGGDNTATTSCPYIRPWERCARSEATPAPAKPFAAALFLHQLGNRTLLLVGDSVQGQLFVALACGVHEQAPEMVSSSHMDWIGASHIKTLSKRCGHERGRCHFWSGCLSFESGGRLCWTSAHTPQLAGIAQWLTKHMAKFAPEPALLVLAYGSMALQYTGAMPLERFEESGRQEALQLVRALSARSPRPKGLWRETTAQHFKQPGGFFRGSRLGQTNRVSNGSAGCVPHSPAEMERWGQLWNSGSAEPLRDAGITRMRVWASTRDASDATIGRGDCTHYCQPGVPDAWAAMLVDSL